MRRKRHRFVEQLEDRRVLSASPLSETVLECCSTQSSSIAHAVDIDGDGDTDIVSDDLRGSGRAILLENLGDGTFADKAFLPVDSLVRSIDSGDLDGDGDIDLVVSTTFKSVKLLLNQGDATFRAASVVSGETNDSSLRVGDLDGDGDLDIVSFSRRVNSDELFFHQNSGNGSFSTQRIGEMSFVTRDIELIDADQDNDLDIVAAALTGGQFVVIKNTDGQASFGSVQAFNQRPNARSIAVGDFNGDAKNDIVTLSEEALVVHKNTGNSGSPFASAEPILQANLAYTSPKTADVDGDGDVDIVAITQRMDAFEYDLVWFENQGTGFGSSQAIAPIYPNAVGPGIEAIDVADFNGDGNVDVVLASGGTIAWYDNANGLGDFSKRNYASLSPFYSTQALADFDGDGDLDLMASDASARQTVWHENDGTGNFINERSITAGDYSIRQLAVDFDRDGDIDFLNAIDGYATGEVLFQFAANDSNGNFAAPIEISGIPYDQQFNIIKSLIASDFRGDDGIDILALIRGNVILLESIGSGGEFDFREPVTLVESDYRPGNFFLRQAGFQEIAVADLDGDGLNDIVTADYERDGDTLDISWYSSEDGFSDRHSLGQYEATFNAKLEIADVRGNGDLDVLATLNDGRLAWFENAGGGQFEEPFVTERPEDDNSLRGPALEVALTDFDNDGDLDAVGSFAYSASSTNPQAGYFEFDRASNSFGSPTVIFEDERFLIGDIDGDGSDEILRDTTGGISLLEPKATFGDADFNSDGSLDATDVDWLFAAIRGNSLDSRFDLDNSGTIDHDDSTFLIEEVLGTVFGDVNLDGKVDTTDLNRVGLHWRQNNTGWASGDFNGDGRTDAADLNRVGVNWQKERRRSPRAALATEVESDWAVDTKWEKVRHHSAMSNRRAR